MGSPVTQWQMLSKNPDRTAQFYSQMFGWTVSADNPLGYRQVAPHSTGGIEGGIRPAPPEAPSFVQLFITVDDMQAQVSKATALGARVLIPPQTLPEGDQLAIPLDPEGMSFELHYRSAN